MLRPYILRPNILRPYVLRPPIRPGIPRSQHRFSRAPQLQFVLRRKRALRDPDLEPRTIGAARELDDAGRRALDDLNDGTQRFPFSPSRSALPRFPFPFSRFPVVRGRDGGYDAVGIEPARHIPLERPPGGVPTIHTELNRCRPDR